MNGRSSTAARLPAAGSLLAHDLELRAGVGEDFGGEGFDRSSRFPGMRRQAGLAAGLFEEGDAVPAVLGGDLRQQQSALSGMGDDQSVTTDHDVLSANQIYRRKNTDRNPQMLCFA